jgi:chemotaxis protein CheC
MQDEMGILKEIATVAGAHGSNALSQILMKKVKLSLPTMDMLDSGDFLEKELSDDIVLSVQCKILTGLEGKISLILKEESAFKLITMCYKGESYQPSGLLTEIGLSVVKEVGSVVIGSYIGALSMYLKTLVVPSIPTLLNGTLREVLKSILGGEEKKYILLINTVFEVPEEQVEGRIYFVLTQSSIELIQKACKKILESLKE